jgi:predicted nucleotidyltransferase
MNISDVLRRITTALDQADVAYMLTGSFASAFYGSPRSTQDIDVIIEATPAQLSTFVDSLPVDEYYSDLDAALEAHKAESMFNVVDRSSGWKIDFIIRKSRPFSREEFRRRVRVYLEGVSLFIASAEDIVIAKLEWSKLAQSQRQIDDVASILRTRRETLDRSYIEKWTRELRVEAEWDKARLAAGI